MSFLSKKKEQELKSFTSIDEYIKYFDKKTLKDFEFILKENQTKTQKPPIKQENIVKQPDENLEDFLLKCLDKEKLFPKNKNEEIIKDKILEIPEKVIAQIPIVNLPEPVFDEIKPIDPDYYPNACAFTCTLCRQKIPSKEGITLQNCLHNFCLSCLEDVIIDNTAAEVKCPFMEYDCYDVLLDTEIKSLVSKEIYDIHLDKSLIHFTGQGDTKTQAPTKWLCNGCRQLNSCIKIRCVYCDDEKPKPIVKKSEYEELLTLEEGELIESYEDFECPICFVTYGIGEGFMLRECLHVFCKECLSDTITNSDVPQIKCPYMDDDYSCDEVLQNREIRSAITEENYEKYLKMCLNMAEKSIKESYHCLTVDCHGWWINEDEANAINCPVCGIQNCLNCNAIHTNLNCKQYQDHLYNAPDKQAQRTKQLIEDLLAEGVAMKCPKCGIIIQRNEGCDWMTCTMCLTEICWATKGPRWGPLGKGDTSGGCKCTKEKRCAPQCKYCH